MPVVVSFEVLLDQLVCIGDCSHSWHFMRFLFLAAVLLLPFAGKAASF
jgi:hypothetical protein